MLYLKKKYLQESGITLLELLVTIVISALVMGLAFSVLTSSIKYNEKTQASINLKKEANYVISQLRQLHNGPEHEFCYEESLSDKRVSFKNIELGINNPNSKKCFVVNTSKELKVNFTLTDNQNNQFEMKTIIETNRPSQSVVAIEIERPKKGQDLYDVLKVNNIFSYGSNLSITGGASINSSEDGQGTLIIDNNNFNDLIFPGNTPIKLKKIIINKKDKNIRLESSIKLGLSPITELISIKGDLQLLNGGIEISGKHVYIDGNVNFDNSAKIFGEKVFINGDVVFKNYSANIIANEIYITGKVTAIPGAPHSSLKTIPTEKIDIPSQLILEPFTFRENSWYLKNGYISEKINTNRLDIKLENGMKIFAKRYENANYMSSAENVIIVSQGDIIIGNMGGATLSGLLFAPNGKVEFTGGHFNGMIIAKNGFYFYNGGGTVQYKSITNYIKDNNDFPLQFQ